MPTNDGPRLSFTGDSPSEMDRPIMPLFRGTDDLERRGELRFSCDGGTSCQILDPRSGYFWPAAIRNLSSGGICLVTGRQFQCGELLTLELKNPARGFVRKCLVEVKHSDICCPNDSWLHGCRFARPLREEEVQALIRQEPMNDDLIKH